VAPRNRETEAHREDPGRTEKYAINRILPKAGASAMTAIRRMSRIAMGTA